LNSCWTQRPQSVTILTVTFAQAAVKFQTAITLLLCSCFLNACQKQETPPVESRPLESNSAKKASSQVHLSNNAVKLAGIESSPVLEKANLTEIKTTGQIKADENRVFHINSLVPGRIIKDNVVLGNSIKSGDVLAIVQNLEVAKTFGDYISKAHDNETETKVLKAKLDLFTKNLDRLNALNKEGIVAQKDLITAQSTLRVGQIDYQASLEHAVHIRSEAKALLSAYGINLDKIEKNGLDIHEIKSGSPLVSPRSGVVIEKTVTVGDVVNPSQPLYVVADLSEVWLDITVYDKDLENIKQGEVVIFQSDSMPNLKVEGKITYIQPSAGENTRTFLARASLPNPRTLIKPGMFGQVSIKTAEGLRKPYLPDSAIQKNGEDTFVFIDEGSNSYQKRTVHLGERLGDGFLVNDGLRGGEHIVHNGSFQLKSELLKAQVGGND
jgi:membrane fusion protein, heavy metal efflux system